MDKIGIAKYILACLLWLWLVPVAAKDSPKLLVLTNASAEISAVPYLDILEDPSRRLTLADVSSPAYRDKFIANTQNRPSFGRTYSAIWVRFELSNQTAPYWSLVLDSSIGDQVDLFIMSDKANVTAQTAQRQEDYRRPLWFLQLPQGQKLRFYIRATNAGTLLNMPVKLFTPDALLLQSIDKYRIYTAIFATLLTLAAYNLFLFFILREASYLTLVVHITAVFCTLHRTNPIFESLSFLSKTNNYFFSAPLFLTTASLGLFVCQVLQTKTKLPKFDTALKTIIGLSILCIPTAGLFATKNLIAVSLLAILMIVAFFASLSAFLHRDTIAKHFFFVLAGMVITDVSIFTTVIFNPINWSLDREFILGCSSAGFSLLLSLVQAERVRLIRESIQSIKAAGAAKDSFLATMSHELRTPLNAIFGLSTLLQLSDLDIKQRDYVKKLAASSRYMLQLIGNILDIKKIENRNFQLEYKPLVLKMVLTSVYDLLYEQAYAKGLNLVFRGFNEIPEVIYADKVRLSQILINLLGNGIKYTPRGEVTLTVQKQPSSTPGTLVIRFDIVDTGPGIAAGKLHELFKPFVQLQQKEDYCKDGAGLGLFISKNLVEMMGGTLEVSSSPGQGCHFFFNLAFNIQSAPTSLGEDITMPEAIAKLPGTRILLVDDYELNVFIWRKLLSSIGADVTIALDGKSTILQLQQGHFDIVLIDISLPDMDGFEVTRWIRTHSQTPKIPIMALTAYATAEVEQQCKEAGMDGFLSKPFELQDLSVTIQQILYST